MKWKKIISSGNRNKIYEIDYKCIIRNINTLSAEVIIRSFHLGVNDLLFLYPLGFFPGTFPFVFMERKESFQDICIHKKKIVRDK